MQDVLELVGEAETQKDQQQEEGSLCKPEMLTVEEAAAYLRISLGSAYTAVKTGQMPGAMRINRIIRVSRRALEDATTMHSHRDPSESAAERGDHA
jgi:excisionase family DNA binding protein